MTHDSNSLTSLSPTITYARLLRQVHDLNAKDDGTSDEAAALADEMDAPWYAMSPTEQKRMRGLSQDLYALREGGPKRVEMSPAELKLWQQRAIEAYTRLNQADVDWAFAFARQPVPKQLPAQFIPFLQALCWENLGDLETSLVFMREAEGLDSSMAMHVLYLLQKLNRADEVPDYVERIISNSSSTAAELYFAANALLVLTLQMNTSQATPILEKTVSILNRALAAFDRESAKDRHAYPELEAIIYLSLGACLGLLRDLKSAIAIFSGALDKHPHKAELFAARGLALYEDNQPSAWTDLEKAVRLQVPNIWPYLLLSQRALQMGAYGEALRLALAAEAQPGPPSARAEAYELIAMANAELGQPQDIVLQNFDRAIELDSRNVRIRENRDIAAKLPVAPADRFSRPRLKPPPPIKSERLRQARREQINLKTDLLSEQLRSCVTNELVPAGVT